MTNNTPKGLGLWRGIHAVNTFKYQNTKQYLKLPEYKHEVVEDSEQSDEMFLSLLYSHAVYINARGANHIVIANNTGYVLIVNLLEVTDEEIHELFRILRSSATKVFRNAKETLKVLKKHSFAISGPYFDITIAEKVLGIASDSNETTDIDINKILHQCKTSLLLHKKLIPQINETIELEFNCVDAVVEMEVNGMYVNRDLLKDTQTDYAKHINPTTNRIHASFEQIGSATGRIITSKPSIQNASRETGVRKCFQAPVGNVLVIGDYSQIELRIVAEITKDKIMIEALNQDKDIHRLTSSIILKKEFDDVTSQERQASKAINYGLVYGMGVSGLVKYAKQAFNVELTEEDAQYFRHAFFRSYRGIQRWHEAAAKKKLSKVKSLGGRVREWPLPPDTPALCNSKVQSTTSDILKKALVFLMEEKKFYKYSYNVINVIHDEIILETSLKDEIKTRETLDKSMIRAGQYYLKTVPTVVNIAVGIDWSAK